ncbi:MAG: rhodanese-like domain-containing protein [Thermincolia bacterium]
MTVEHISPTELKNKLNIGETMYILDLRPKDEFEQHHIRGSNNVPFGELQNSSNKIPDNQEVVLVCFHGAISVSAAEYLDSQGYENLAVLDGGIEGWEQTSHHKA